MTGIYNYNYLGFSNANAANQPAPAPVRGNIEPDLASLLENDLRDITTEFEVAGGELALYIGTINGKLPTPAFSALTGKKLDFFTRLTRFLLGESADFREQADKLTGKELAELIANNPKLRKILADYLAFKTGRLRLEVSDNRFLSIKKDGQILSINSMSEEELNDLADALQAGAFEAAKPSLAKLFGQNVVELKKTAAGKIEAKLASGANVSLNVDEVKILASMKRKLADIKDAAATGAEKAAEADIAVLAGQMQELARLGYTTTAPDDQATKRIRTLENQGIDLDSLQVTKTENSAPALKKGGQIFVYDKYTSAAHNDLKDALESKAVQAAKADLATLLGKPAEALDKVTLAGEAVTVEFKNGSKLVIGLKELDLIQKLNTSGKAAAGAELTKLGYQLIAPSAESPRMKAVYQNTGKAKIKAFRQALAPFEALTQVTFAEMRKGEAGDDKALLEAAVRLHAAVKNLKEDISYLYTTLANLGLDMKEYEKYLKDSQLVLDLLVNEKAFKELSAGLVKLVEQNLANPKIDELTKKALAARKDNLLRVSSATFTINREDVKLIFSDESQNAFHLKPKDPAKTKPADIITALFEFARSPFRTGLPAEYITLQFGSTSDFGNLVQFSNFAGKKIAEYRLPEESEGDEEAKKAAETVFDALAEEKGKLFWSNRRTELAAALDYFPLPLPRLRGKIDGQLHFSDGLVRLISLRTEALPGNYRSDAEALVKGNLPGGTIGNSLAPLLQVLAGKTGLKPEEIKKFFDRTTEEKAQIVFIYDPVKKEPHFYYFRSGELAKLSDKEQNILRAFWEISYTTEQQDEKLTKKGKLTGAIENSLTFVSEGDIQSMQIEKLALQLAALCVNSGKVADINTLSQEDIQNVLSLAYQLLQAGRKDEEIVSKFHADVEKNEKELEKARKNLKKQVAEANSNADDADENLFGASVEQTIEASERISEYRSKVAAGASEQKKKFQSFQENLDKAKARLELAKFFIKEGRKLFGADVNGQFLYMVASRVKLLLSELPKLSNQDLKAMLAQLTLPSSETYVLTPALLQASIFALAGNQYQKQNVEDKLGAGALAPAPPDLWDKSLLNDVPLVGRTKINSEQGLYGIVLNHPAVAVLAYLSDELHYDFWRELPRTSTGDIPLDIHAGISGEFLMRLGSHLVQKYGDRFQYMIIAGQVLKGRGIILGDKEVATPTGINHQAFGRPAGDPEVKVISDALQFLNGVYQLSLRKFQPIEGDMLARSFELKDKTVWNRLSGVGRSTFKIPLSGAQKQFQMIISQDIMLMKEDLGLPYPAIVGPESYEIDHKFVRALLDSPYRSYLRGSKTAAFFGQPNEKPESKIGQEATAEPEKFMRAYLAEHPEFSFSLNLGFEDVIDEKAAWAKLLIMRALSNYAVSDSNPVSRAAKKALPLPEADTVFSIFLQQDMMEPGKWNRALNIFLYQSEQFVPGAGATLKHNHVYTAAQVNFLGKKMLETVQNLPEESRKPILEQVNDIFNVFRMGKDKESIDKGMASLEQFARLLADYRGERVSFETIGLTGGFDRVRRALYILSRVFLPMMTVRAKGEDESKVVSSRFLQRYRQELKSGRTLVVENFIAPPKQPGFFVYGARHEEGAFAALSHSVTELIHLHLFMHPEIMIGLQAGFLRSIGKALAEGRHGDAVELFWQQMNTLAMFKAFELFPPALIASAVEKYKQGNKGSAAIQMMFAWFAFRGLHRLTQMSWRSIKRARYVIAEHTSLGKYDKAIGARIARLEAVMTKLPASMAELGQRLTEMNDLMNQKASAGEIAAKGAEVQQAQTEVNNLLGRTKKNAEKPKKTLKKATKQQQRKLPARLMADKYTAHGKAGTRVNFEVFADDGTEIALPKRGLASRVKDLLPYRRGNNLVDVIWNAEDLAVEGVTLGGAELLQNQDLARVTSLLEKMVELARSGDKPVKLRFGSISEGVEVIEIKPSQVVRAFYLQHQNVISKIASIPDALQLEKPVEAAVNLASKIIRKKEVHALPGSKKAAKIQLSQELASRASQAVVNKFLNSVQTQAAYCSTRVWNLPAKLFNARAATRVFRRFYVRLPKPLRSGASIATAPEAPAPRMIRPTAPTPAPATNASAPQLTPAPQPLPAPQSAAEAIIDKVKRGAADPLTAAQDIFRLNPTMSSEHALSLLNENGNLPEVLKTVRNLNLLIRGKTPQPAPQPTPAPTTPSSPTLLPRPVTPPPAAPVIPTPSVIDGAVSILGQVSGGKNAVEAAYEIFDLNPNMGVPDVHRIFNAAGQSSARLLEVQKILNLIIRGKGPARPIISSAPAPAPHSAEAGFNKLLDVFGEKVGTAQPKPLNPKTAAAWAKYEKLVKDGKINSAKALNRAKFAKYYNGCQVFEKALGFVMTVAIIHHIAHSDNKAEAVARVATGFGVFIGSLKSTDLVVGKIVKHPLYRFVADLAIASGLTAGADQAVIDPIIKQIGIELNGTNWEAFGGAAGYFLDVLGGGPAISLLWNAASKPDEERAYLERKTTIIGWDGYIPALKEQDLNSVPDWNRKVAQEIATRQALIDKVNKQGTVTATMLVNGRASVTYEKMLLPGEKAEEITRLNNEIREWQAKRIDSSWDKRQAFQLGQKLAKLRPECNELIGLIKQMNFAAEDKRKLLGVLENLEAFAFANTVDIDSEVYKLAEYVILPGYLDRGVKEPRNEFKNRFKALVKGYKSVAGDVAFYNRIGRRHIADNWNNPAYIEEVALKLLSQL
ncbi:MAG: hypothetical protein JW873_06670 [Candidatus Saganbacteria bacterium]|nr:hypothetical protein [Candidatus Saganbacteria bacterium]